MQYRRKMIVNKSLLLLNNNWEPQQNKKEKIYGEIKKISFQDNLFTYLY